MTLINKKYQLTSSRITARMNTLTLLVWAVLALCSTVPMHSFGASAMHMPSSSTRESNNPSVAYTRVDESEKILILPTTSSSPQVHKSRTSLDAELLEQNDHEDTPLWKRINFILLCAGVSVLALCISIVVYFFLVSNFKDAVSTVNPFSNTSVSLPEILPTQSTKNMVSTVNSLSSTYTPPPETLSSQSIMDMVSTANSLSSTSTPPPEILPPHRVKYEKLIVSKKTIRMDWGSLELDKIKLVGSVDIRNEFNNVNPWQKNVVFKKSDMKGVERIMGLAKGVLNSMLAHQDFNNRIEPEKIPKILPSIETLLNDRDALDRFAKKSFIQEALTAYDLTNPSTPEYKAMNNGTLYYRPDGVTYIYGDVLDHMSLYDQAHILLWLLRTGADDFLAYIEPVFQDFDNYVLRKPDIEDQTINTLIVFSNTRTILKTTIYEITCMLNQMNIYPNINSKDDNFLVNVENWILNNTLLNTQDPPKTAHISESAMKSAAFYYNELELLTAMGIFGLVFHPESLASLVDDINKKG